MILKKNHKILNKFIEFNAKINTLITYISNNSIK